MAQRDDVTRKFNPLASYTELAAEKPAGPPAPPAEEISLRAAAIQTRLDDLLPSLRQPILSEFILNEIQIRRAWGLRTTLDDLLAHFTTNRELLESVWINLPHLATVEATQLGDSAGAAQTEAMPIREIPQQIGSYRVEDCLGEGSFGIVYRATHVTSGETVAIKLLKTWQARDAARELKLRTQFAAEAETMARFDHANIVRVLEINAEANPPYFVQQFVDGMPLADRLANGIPSLIEALEFCRQIADGLAHIHAQEKWHRDLKPANILLDQTNHVYLADFGLVLDNSQRWEVERIVAGTFQYMAPEQVQASTHLLNAKCDLWSLGVILYEMLTGKRPFKGETTDRLRDEILYRTPASPRELNQEIPRAVNHLCMQCLSKSDADRPHSAADLRDDFASIIQELQQPDHPPLPSALSPLPSRLSPTQGSRDTSTASSFSSSSDTCSPA